MRRFQLSLLAALLLLAACGDGDRVDAPGAVNGLTGVTAAGGADEIQPATTVSVPNDVIPASIRGRQDGLGIDAKSGDAQRWVDAWCSVEVGETMDDVLQEMGEPTSVFLRNLEQTATMRVDPQFNYMDESAGVTLTAAFDLTGIVTRLSSSGQVSPAGCDPERPAP